MAEAEEAPAAPGEDEDEPVYEINPEEDVYSFMMFVGPTESVKAKGRFNVDTCVGMFLVVVTLTIQGYLLWAVFNSVITGNIKWETGIVNTGQGWNLVGKVEGCNTGKSLCTIEADDKFSCAPPSVRLTGRWYELDTNGDGIWTREEVMAAREDLKCKYIVDPVEVFDVFVTFVINREKIIWVHPEVRAGNAIPQPYFTYASGDIIMCGYRNEKMCANLFKSGFFDAPLEFHTVPRVGKTIDSAIFYCRELLKPGGTCERVLPSTYSVWKVESDQECKDRKYSKFTYEHPTSGDVKSFLSVDYKARLQYEKTQTPLFKLYKTLIILIWVMSMVYEFKKMLVIATWVARMPSDKSVLEAGSDTVEVGLDKAYVINGITFQQRTIQAIVTAIRLVMLIILTWVGTSLLVASPEYMSLLFDAVSLKFILDIQSLIYSEVLRQKVRDQNLNVKPMEVTPYGPAAFHRSAGMKDLIWFVVMIVLTILFVYLYYVNSVIPLGEAIECTCLGRGDKCVEASNFTYDFWHDYWKHKTPQVFKDVDVLKARHEAGGGLLGLLANGTSALAHSSASRNLLAQRQPTRAALAPEHYEH